MITCDIKGVIEVHTAWFNLFQAQIGECIQWFRWLIILNPEMWESHVC